MIQVKMKKEYNDIQDFTPFKILEERKKNRIFEYLVHCNSPFQDLPDKQVWMVRKQIPSHIMGKYLRDKKSNKMNEKEEEVESEKEEVEEKKEKEIENIPIKKQKRKEMTKIEEIVDLGFTEKEAIFTLKKFNNNITKAINFLVENMNNLSDIELEDQPSSKKSKSPPIESIQSPKKKVSKMSGFFEATSKSSEMKDKVKGREIKSKKRKNESNENEESKKKRKRMRTMK